MGKIIGIDLGTTFCCVSYRDELGIIRTIDSRDGGTTTPSIVYFDPNGNNAIVGVTARQEGAMHPEYLVERIKNRMCTPGYVLSMNGQDYSPAAVSSLILSWIIRDAEEKFGDEDIEGAVITVPAYFPESGRQATRLAGENVVLKNGKKLKVLAILDEPVAASIAYGNSVHEDVHKTALIYDLGGGTFDCTVMRFDFEGDNKNLDMITTNGDHNLGGKDWDSALSDYVVSEFCARTGEDVYSMKSDPETIAWLSENIERAKIVLTARDSTSLSPSYNGKREKIEITREKFEELTSSLLDKTILLINDMMAEKGLSMESDIDEIIMVGSSTKMPQVQNRLEAEYGKSVKSYEPEKAVAMGAALVASSIKEDGKDGKDDDKKGGVNGGNKGPLVIRGEDGGVIKLETKCTMSYGLVALDHGTEVVANIIFKDTEKPAAETRGFVTNVPDQRELKLRVFENNSLKKNATLDESEEIYESCIVELTPGLPHKAPIDITFSIDRDGILTITALDVTNGISKTVIPQRKGGDDNTAGMDAANNLELPF